VERSCHDSTISVTQKEVLIKESILGFAKGKGAESRLCNSFRGGQNSIRRRNNRYCIVQIREYKDNHSTPIIPAGKILALVFNPESAHLSNYISLSQHICACSKTSHMKSSPD